MKNRLSRNLAIASIAATISVSALAGQMTGAPVRCPAPNQVVSWGENNYGQTDVPSTATNVIQISAGEYHTLAILSNNTVISWGGNSYGETNVPKGLSNVVQVAAGSGFSLALLSSGTVVAWGGNGISGAAAVTNIPDLEDAIAIAAGPSYGLAIRSDSTVVAWGVWETNGALRKVPVPAGLSNAVSISAGWNHAAARHSDGSVVMWGDDIYGECDFVPANNVAVCCGNRYTTALCNDGTVMSWGLYDDNNIAVPMGLGDIVGISVSDYASLARTADGRIVAWGSDNYGESDVPVPLPVALTVSVGGFFGVAVVNPNMQVPTVLSMGMTYGGEPLVTVTGITGQYEIDSTLDPSVPFTAIGTVEIQNNIPSVYWDFSNTNQSSFYRTIYLGNQ